jgi:hypothetical protein
LDPVGPAPKHTEPVHPQREVHLHRFRDGRLAGEFTHIRHWADGGPTDFANLVLLCGFHHRLIHQSAWEVEMHAGRPRFRPPAFIDSERKWRSNIPISPDPAGLAEEGRADGNPELLVQIAQFGTVGADLDDPDARCLRGAQFGG